MPFPTLLTGSDLRSRLEIAYAQGLTEEVLQLSQLMDQLQLERLEHELAVRQVAV